MNMLVCILSFSFGLTAFAQVSTYDKQKTRATLLGYLEHPPTTRLEFVGEPADEKARAFLDFFRDHVNPWFDEESTLTYKYYGLMLLRDSGSQTSQDEFDAWTKQMLELLAEDARRTVDKKWTATLVEWARLAEGLGGQLPDFARRAARQRVLGSFDPEFEPLLKRINELTTEYDDVLRVVPAVEGKPEAASKRLKMRIAFKEGRISFDEAIATQRDLDSRVGDHFVGFEAAERAGEKLNEIAILRTKLAHSKGYRTWAAYQLELSSGGYSVEYKGLDNQRRWLTEYIKAMAPVQEFFLTARLKELGLEHRRDEIHLQDLGLISAPGQEMLEPYFPKEHITSMWVNTLNESGFRPETLRQILVDDEFRDNKNRNGAYQASVDSPKNAVSRIDARELRVLPIVRTRPELKDGLAYILQSYAGRGLEDLRTAFHEGGHATERILKFKEDPSPEGYGYVEVPSLMSEYFLRDPDVVHKLAVPANGKKPTRAEVATYLGNTRKTALINMVYGLKMSLFDIELWDIDYTAEGAPTFLEAVKEVDDRVDALAPLVPKFDGPVAAYWGLISTPHFTSGEVRNIGYDFAALGAHMMAEFISDELEKETGRRNWFEQPGFARIYTERFVSQGWRKPFPENIEWITGRKFDPADAVNDFARQIGMPPCGSLL